MADVPVSTCMPTAGTCPSLIISLTVAASALALIHIPCLRFDSHSTHSHPAMLKPIVLLSSLLGFLDPNVFAASDESQVDLGPHPAPYQVVDCPLNITSFECGIVEVPLDWQDQGVGTTAIQFFRHSVHNATARKGTIFVHEGGSQLGHDHTDWLLGLQFMLGRSLDGVFGDEYDFVYWAPRDRNLTGLRTAQCFKHDVERTTFYKRMFRHELQYEPEWYEDGTVTWDDVQGPEDVRMFLKAQEKTLKYCAEKMGSAELFKYVGTAATARDVAALADLLDGPGSPINMWTQGHGSVVASYVMKLFPERLGRIVMDNPADPVAFTEMPGHLRWLADVAALNNSLAVLEEKMRAGVADGYTVSTGFLDYDIARYKSIVNDMSADVIGWKNRLDREALWDAIREQNAAWSSAYSLSLSIPLHRGITGANVFRHSHRDPSTLGGMPLVCGDSINADSDDESARIAVTEFLVDNIESAPILTASAFPPMRYLCHLWPVRAVERISLRPPYETDLSEHLLVLLNKKDYWTYFTVLESTARQLWPGAHVVGGLQYGEYTRLWDHDQCSLDIVDRFFRGRTMSQVVSAPSLARVSHVYTAS
ncbi:hypothetical protein C8Q76DRAFT_264523 [Earliella scabrosa]|nr:hypothetical protein C8Q76DRAFT_264523 [Earliella scabrosa]